MGGVLSAPLSYWRSENNLTGASSDSDDQQEQSDKTSSDQSSNRVSGGDHQDEANLDDDKLTDDRDEDDESEDVEQNNAIVESTENNEGNEDTQDPVNYLNDVETETEQDKESDSHHENGAKDSDDVNGGENVTATNYEAQFGTINGNTNPVILLNDIVIEQQLSEAQSVEFSSDFEAAKAAYAARQHNMGKHILNTHQKQSPHASEARKRDHSADSDRSTPNYPQYLRSNDLPITSRSKRTKSSETDSVSSSRSDRASVEIEQVVTPKSAKSKKRRGKAAKKYLS